MPVRELRRQQGRMGGAGNECGATKPKLAVSYIYERALEAALLFSGRYNEASVHSIYVYTHSHAAAAAVVRSTRRRASAIGPLPLASAHFCVAHTEIY